MIGKLLQKSNTRKDAGFTLVELLVSMTLTAIFATAIVALMPSATKIYIQIQTMSRAQVVADMVVDSLREECADAYIEDFASVRIVNLSLPNTYSVTEGDQPLLSCFATKSGHTTTIHKDVITGPSDTTGNVLIIRKNNGYCQAVYSCMPISYSNYESVKDANALDSASLVIPSTHGGISSRAVYRFFPGGQVASAAPETLQGYVHFGYYQCGKENLDVGSNTVNCIYPAVRYDYTTPFSSTAYNGYTVDLEFSDLETSSSNLYDQRPLSVKVTVKVYKSDFEGQSSDTPIYTRSAVLVFAEDTTE